MLNLLIIGHLGADAVLREENGRKFVTFRVAHTERFQRSDGTAVENTSWVSCILNGDGGGLLPYLTKGTLVFCSGDATFRCFSSKAARGFVGSADIRVRSIELIGGKKDAVPSRLYDSDGQEILVNKAFFVDTNLAKATTLKSRAGDLFAVDDKGYVSPAGDAPESASDTNPNTYVPF